MGRKKKYNTEEERLEAKRLARKKYRDNNKEKVVKQVKQWSDNNLDKRHENYLKNKKELTEEQKEKKKLYMEGYREDNKERLIQYRKDNKDKLRENSKRWAKENPEKLRENTKRWELNNPEQNKINKNKSRKKRIENDLLFRVSCNIRSAIAKSIRRNGYKKTSKTEEILGCSFEEFKQHIESQWEDWMSWDNYGLYNGKEDYGWDIDHIIAVSLAINEGEVIKLNHISNLQPLCSKVNRDIKKNNIIIHF